MLSTNLTAEISTLSRFEKILLIEKISQMLLEDEKPDRYFEAEKQYPVFTPLNQENAASQLQQMIEQQNS